MLLLVTTHIAQNGFFRRRKADKGKLPPLIKGISLGEHPAAMVVLQGRHIGVNLKYLRPYRQRGDVLICDRSVDKRLGLNQSVIDEYARRLCVNLALHHIKANGHATDLVLIDHQGECVGVAAELLKVCNTVWVATRRPEWFDPCAAYTRERYGNQPLMVETALPLTDLVIAPYGLQNWQYRGGLLFGPNGGIFPKNEQLYLPDYAHLPDFDPAAVTAGVFAAFHPKELMTALPNIQI